MPSELQPPGESLRRALRWIGAARLADANADVKRLVAEAGLRFDLTPPEQEYLWHTLVLERHDVATRP
jgi:hypothetical protein